MRHSHRRLGRLLYEAKLLFDDHKKTIIYGFVYLAVIYFVGWELIMKP